MKTVTARVVLEVRDANRQGAERHGSEVVVYASDSASAERAYYEQSHQFELQMIRIVSFSLINISSITDLGEANKMAIREGDPKLVVTRYQEG